MVEAEGSDRVLSSDTQGEIGSRLAYRDFSAGPASVAATYGTNPNAFLSWRPPHAPRLLNILDDELEAHCLRRHLDISTLSARLLALPPITTAPSPPHIKQHILRSFRARQPPRCPINSLGIRPSHYPALRGTTTRDRLQVEGHLDLYLDILLTIIFLQYRDHQQRQGAPLRWPHSYPTTTPPKYTEPHNELT